MLSIGEFSKICSVTTKTLRYYDEIRLIRPVYTAENGYRYYDISQLKTMLLINRLKSYGFSLEEIAESILVVEEEKLLSKLRKKEKEILQQMDDFDLLLKRLRLDAGNLERGIPLMEFMDKMEVKLTEREPVSILYTRQEMSVEDYGKYFGKLYEIIAKEKLTIIGPPMSIYHCTEFKPEKSDIEVAIPVIEAVKGTRELSGGLHASIVHKGVYSELTTAYARLTEWVEKEGYQLTNPPLEIYRTNIMEARPDEQVTEIYFPVKKR